MKHLLFCLLPFLITIASTASAFAEERNAADVFGVAHVDGKYYLTDADYLDEGADQILATGTKVIKLYLTPRRYPWNSDWPAGLSSLTDIARTKYFRSVFSRPFHTYILTAYAVGREDHYWVNGVSSEQAADETRQFHDLTRYLLTQYQGSHKTFILQHWEGDWALRHNSPKPYDPNYLPTPTAVRGMIAWLNARQAGIVAARNEIGSPDVRVFGATEINRVEDSMAGKPGVANSVLPHTTVDLASYSCYNFLNTAARLSEAVDYIAAHLPPTAVFGQSARNVYLGEYGYPENGQEGREGVNRRIDNVLEVVHAKEMPWAVYWEIYCNEPKDPNAIPPLNGKQNDGNLRGYWMVKPDGTPSLAWHRYRSLCSASDASRRNSDAVKSRLNETFHDRFDRADASDLGDGWTQAAHYGVVTKQVKNHHLQFDIPDGKDIPWGSATLDLDNPRVLGHGLEVGDYFEITERRLSEQGGMGIELFDSDQLRVGSDLKAGLSDLRSWNGTTWVTVSFDDRGQPVTFDWNRDHVIGVRFDSADGYTRPLVISSMVNTPVPG
jgi:hypothetical protein